MAAPAPFNVTASVLGQPWAWRGGLGPDAADGLDGMVERLFASRGAARADFARLRAPTLRDWLPDPSAFRDMDAGAARIADAVARGEKVVVFGDYDVDGATSAALLVRLLRALGTPVGWYIPDRLLEGYGPSADAMRAIRAGGADLVVTVDCGTQGFEALDAASAAGLDAIVVDHHRASTRLPQAVAVINPNRLDEGETGRAHGHLAAVGVAFLLGIALVRTLRERGWFARRAEPKLLELLDLVALGTVADVAPLTGLNRAFVAQGLKVLAARRNVGLAALVDVAGIERAPECKDLGFALGPRINAGGRIGRAELGVRLLVTEDASEARAIAVELDRLNGERRTLEAVTAEQALALCAGCERAVTVVAAPGWHPGVIGIVASRVKERRGRPAVVIAIGDDGVAKGSGRSVPGVDLGGAVLAARESGLLDAGGGHAMAAGLTVAAARIGPLTDFLNERLAADVAQATGARALLLDAALGPRGVCVELAAALAEGGPYGQGWAAPRVASGPWVVVKCDVVGENHVRVVMAGADGARCKGIAFRAADNALGASLAAAGRRAFYAAGRVQRDDWGREPAAELHLDDIAWAD